MLGPEFVLLVPRRGAARETLTTLQRVTEMLNECAKRLIFIWMWVVGIIFAGIVRVLNWRPSKRLPRIRNPLLLHSASQLAHMIRHRQVTSEEVVQAYISRIRDVEPLLNCLVDERFEAALQEARQVDALITSGSCTPELMARDTPFLGVPLSVKESIAVQGLSHTSGQKLPAPRIAEKDAETVLLMRQAGAIPLVVTNTPELCMCYETFNRNTGRTNNPFDLRRTPGGSSGGEAALLASAGSVVGLASDVGGSARLPAFFTGIFGHKPTPGTVSNVGHCPSSTDPDWNRYFSVALMSRYAEDLAPTLKVMSGEQASKLNLDDQVNVTKLRVFYIDDDGGVFTKKLSSEVKANLHKAVNHMEQVTGKKAEKLNIEDMKDMFEVASCILLRMKKIECMFQKSPDSEEWNSVAWTWLKYLLCLTPYSFPPMLYGLLKRMADKINDNEYKEMVASNERIRAIFKERLGDDAVVLFPTFPDVAHFHGEIYYKFLNVPYLLVFNSTEMPVTQCPVGLTSSGLPVGVQVAANPFQDRLTIAVAKELERAFGGWISPPSSEKEV